METLFRKGENMKQLLDLIESIQAVVEALNENLSLDDYDLLDGLFIDLRVMATNTKFKAKQLEIDKVYDSYRFLNQYDTNTFLRTIKTKLSDLKEFIQSETVNKVILSK